MNVAVRKPMTLAEYLACEERQELRHEFDGLRVIAMAGGTAAHSAIQGNLAAALIPRLRGGPCRFHGSDLKFLTT
jgi:Uma2 family endonuclease